VVLNGHGQVLKGLQEIPGIKKEAIEALIEKLKESEQALFKELGTETVTIRDGEVKSEITLPGFGGLSFGASFSETIKTFAVDEANIKRRASIAWWVFVVVYIIGGVLTLLGSILKPGDQREAEVSLRETEPIKTETIMPAM